MLKIRMHLIIICALLFSMMPMSIVAQTEVDRAEVRRQIAFHRQWMAEHTPNPQTLNDSALIIETVRAIHTVCHEPQVGAMIRHAGKVFGLRELEDYAALRDRQGVDRDDAQANRCLQLLAEEAHKRLGEASYSQAFTEMIWGINSESYEQAKERYHHFHSIAKQLYEREPTAVNHEIWLMAQVVIRTVEGYYGENPTVYRDLKVLTQKVFDLYKEHRLQTEVQVYLLKVLENYYNNSTLYENYYALVNRELMLMGVISNLCLASGSVQAIQDSGISDGKVLVSLRNSSRDGFYEIAVDDNGPGVAKENLDKLFTPKFTTKSSGSGLGLAISRTVIERCRGEIRYSKSFSLGGACFTIYYPKSK